MRGCGQFNKWVLDLTLARVMVVMRGDITILLVGFLYFANCRYCWEVRKDRAKISVVRRRVKSFAALRWHP